MNHPQATAAASIAHETRRKVSICATFDGNRFDLPEGRDWLVTGNHSYVVTIWQDAEFGRMASCRCKAFAVGQLCKHIRYAQLVDSMLTKAPIREIKAVTA